MVLVVAVTWIMSFYFTRRHDCRISWTRVLAVQSILGGSAIVVALWFSQSWLLQIQIESFVALFVCSWALGSSITMLAAICACSPRSINGALSSLCKDLLGGRRHEEADGADF